MGRKSVAVLDVRSSEVAVFLGERGVNNTFVFKASKTESYDGYENGKFYSEENLSSAIFRALSAVEQICGERIRTLFIGVPGEFTEVVPKEQEIGFPKKKKITQKEISQLFESGKKPLKDHRFIRATSMIYVTADNRRTVDPLGIVSAGLSGVLSYFYCSRYFAETMERIFAQSKIALRFLPTQFAMAAYLIPSETRDECAAFLDVDYLSSTVCVLLGNGVLAQRTFWTGKGQVIVKLMEEFSLPYEAATALLGKANLYSKDTDGEMEFTFRGTSYKISLAKLIDAVTCGLDMICEAVGGFLEECSGGELDYKPLYVSGDGLSDVRGAFDHVSKRLNRVCELAVPDLPYYNRPSMSSRIALMDMAYEDNRKSGILYRFINGIGG